MSDIGKMGFQKLEMGADKESAFMVDGAYVGKQKMASKIAEIGKHCVTSQFYSGAPGEEGGEAKDHSPAMERAEQKEYL